MGSGSLMMCYTRPHASNNHTRGVGGLQNAGWHVPPAAWQAQGHNKKIPADPKVVPGSPLSPPLTQLPASPILSFRPFSFFSSTLAARMEIEQEERDREAPFLTHANLPVFRIPAHRCHSSYRFFFDRTENGTDRAPIACHCCGFITRPCLIPA